MNFGRHNFISLDGGQDSVNINGSLIFTASEDKTGERKPVLTLLHHFTKQNEKCHSLSTHMSLSI
jgi:hypothetical protein